MPIQVVPTKKVNLFIDNEGKYARIFCLFFRADGGFNITVPKYKNTTGVIGEAVLSGSELSLGKLGKKVSHMVKLAYPIDGNVHFSEDGKIHSEFKSECSTPLNVSIDHLFTLYSQGLANFSTERTKRNSGVKSFNFYFTPPSNIELNSFRIIGRWYKKGEEKVAPIAILSDFFFTEKNAMTPQFPMYSMAITPSEGLFANKFMLVLSIIPFSPAISNHIKDHLFLIGGFDKRVHPIKDVHMLVSSFPAFGDKIESIDFTKD